MTPAFTQRERNVSELHANPINPRTLKEKAFKELQKSLKDDPHFFQARPLIISMAEGRENTVIAGNQRLEAAKALGWESVPVIEVRDATVEQEKQWMVKDNLHKGEWDFEKLAAGFDLGFLKEMGFDEKGLAKVQQKNRSDDEFDLETALADPETGGIVRGDVYQLGVHKLICGDSTDATTYSLLFGKDVAALMFTDPPYNIGYEGGMNTHGQNKRSKIENDKMSKEAFYDFLDSFLRCSMKHTRGGVYVCMSSQEIDQLKRAFEANGGHWQSFIIWAKHAFTLSRSDWQNQYEPILYGWNSEIKKHFYVGWRDEGNVWENAFAIKPKIEDGKTTFRVGGFEVEVDGELKDGRIREIGEADVWRFKKPSKSTIHPCLPAGQLVYANKQWVPIESIRIGDTTEYGSVIATSEHDAEEIVTIDLEDGQTVEATTNHPFLVIDREGIIAWKEAGLITEEDFVLTNEGSHNTMKPCTTHHLSHQKDTVVFSVTGDKGWNIEWFGKPTKGQSQKECRSIIEMAINSIIELPISSLSLPLSTSGCTPIVDIGTAWKKRDATSVSNGSQLQQNSGTSAHKGGYLANVKNASSSEFASVVRLVLRKVGSVQTTQEKKRVYNLTIEGVPAFDTVIGVSHNTMKPVELVEKAVLASSLQGDIVLDPFLGSGTTLIACENTGRICYGIEYEPKYVWAIIKRWEEKTGKKAKKLF